MAQVCTVIDPDGYFAPDGQFYFGLNGTPIATNLTYAESIPNLSVDSAVDNLVVSYDLDTGISTLWVNATDSTQPSVSLQDVAATNLANVNYVVLRQNAGMGNLLVSAVDVKVVTKPVPAITGLTKIGNTVQISFTTAPGTGNSVAVLGAASLNSPFASVAATITEPTPGKFVATLTATSNQSFYRLSQSATTATVTFPF